MQQAGRFWVQAVDGSWEGVQPPKATFPFPPPKKNELPALLRPGDLRDHGGFHNTLIRPYFLGVALAFVALRFFRFL